jgi:mycothiol synthase
MVERHDGTWALEPAEASSDALERLLQEVRRRGGGHVRWVVSGPSEHTDAVAHAAKLTAARDLPQLRRPLPLGDDGPGHATPTPTRALRPGTADEAAWVEANNRAFAEHPDQGGYTLERLHERMAEPWFDAEGFRLHERDGRLAAFCWTRVHPATADDPELGEIYAIGVDPDFQGLGLGRGLVLAGLEWLAAHGVATAMLYTDSTNTAALSLYRGLGFREHHTDRLYEAHI